ncbi:carboxylesterase/lipase family protein [Paenibacillus sp. Leaf72]|uniref:carboxylesterase/lipase family protein n=1 Tax=Paenibacillus sp. Leaf72 TaxID=1736234 RepID=UPI0006F98BB9|nr:carboxylesterase family protein [Paenibacillus sp. Leaf72]KQO18280.1 hypothetical protein ASF12_06520 [Paenibacillus sp. Leaf72]
MGKVRQISVVALLLAVLFGSMPIYSYASMTVSAAAAVSAEIQSLIDQGMITGNGKALSEKYWSKQATRAQAATLFLRLKGLEKEALSYSGSDSFPDAAKAGKVLQPLVNYLKAHPHLGWLADKDGRFAPQQAVTAQEYARVLLKALGYEAGIDYKEAEVLAFAAKQGLAALKTGGKLTNAQLATATAQALKAKHKISGETLAAIIIRQAAQAPFTADVTQQTAYGAIKGAKDEASSTLSWLGVPYAKAPVGELRWQAPQAPAAWTSTLATTAFAANCTQLAAGKAAGSEDCLYLNIWRPADSSTSLPVLVFAHGGGNMTGSGKDFKGDLLAEATNSIVVSINYRLGALGFFHHPSLATGDAVQDSGNYGLLDIFQALKWVQGNIGGFGGDAANVTLSGQSAGGRDVMAAVISPLSQGLFQKAIVLSGGMTTAPTADGDAKVNSVLAKLAAADGTAADEAAAAKWVAGQTAEQLAAYLRKQPAADLVQQFGGTAIRMAPFPHLFSDGTVLPAEGFNVLKSGKYAQLPMILGSTATEFSAFALSDPSFAAGFADGSLLKDPVKGPQYAAAIKYGSELYSGFNAERAAEVLSARSGQPAVYAYRFAWGTQDGVISSSLQQLIGATHGADMDFILGRKAGIAAYFPDGYFSEQNEPGRNELTAAIHGYWKNFLYTGNPNASSLPAWTPWTAKNGADRILRLDASNEHQTIHMSNEYYKKADVLSRMEKELPADTLKLLQENVLAGRFFW